MMLNSDEKGSDGDRKVFYRAHHIPKGKTPGYWLEWIEFWGYRVSVETGLRELEPIEQLVCYCVMGVVGGLFAYKILSWTLLFIKYCTFVLAGGRGQSCIPSGLMVMETGDWRNMASQDVVLQLGPSSNQTLVHFWNSITQQAKFYTGAGEDSFHSASLLRRLRDQSFSPRTVIFEERNRSALISEGQTELASEITGWRRSNFSSFSPNSILPVDVPSFSGDNAFAFQCGEEYLSQSSNELELALERIRYVVEDCDSLGRMLVSIDSNGFWGGYGSELLKAARDAFKPPSIDIIPIFGDHPNILNKALNIHSHHHQEEARSFPLLLSEDLLFKDTLACKIAALWETFVTGDLFPYFKSPNHPYGLSSMSFGIKDFGIVFPSDLEDLSVTSKKGSARTIDYCIGRAGGVDGSEYPEFLDIPVYLVDQQEYTLRDASSLLAVDHQEQKALRTYVKEHILQPIIRNTALRSSLENNVSWPELRETLESIANPFFLEL